MTTAKLGRRGQITLPREVRGRLQLEEGQRVAFVVKGDDIILQPLTGSLRSLRGFVQVERPQDFEQVRTAVKAELASFNSAGDDA